MPLRCLHPCILAVALALMFAGSASCADETAPTSIYGEKGPLLRLATGSPGELGLVEALARAYPGPLRVAWYKAGSGAALDMLRAGEVDLVIVHAPAAERHAVEAGWAASRTLVGGNRYYLVGPSDDPAGLDRMDQVTEAFRRIAASRSAFVSRADDSGTHRRELQIWRAAGVEPGGPWYRESGLFMSAGLRRANELGAYFLTDSSTWLTLEEELDRLRVLFDGDPRLVNAYHALIAPRSPAVDLARDFVGHLAGPAGQAVMSDHGRGRHGESLYMAAAAVPDTHAAERNTTEDGE